MSQQFYATSRDMANQILRSIAMDSTFRPAPSQTKAYSGETDTCPGCGCEKLVEDTSCGQSECRMTADPVGARIAENTRRNVTDVLREYPTGRKALACSARVKAVWTRELPGVEPAVSKDDKLAARELLACLQSMERLHITHTLGTCLGLIEIVDAARGEK